MTKNLSNRVAALESVTSPLNPKLAVWDPKKETREAAMARAGMGADENEMQIVIELIGLPAADRWDDIGKQKFDAEHASSTRASR